MSTVAEDVTTERTEGRVVAIAGPVVDVEFPPGALPEINYAVDMEIEVDGERIHGHRRGGPADRRGPGALHLPEADRRPPPGHGGRSTPGGASPCRSATPSSATCST